MNNASIALAPFPAESIILSDNRGMQTLSRLLPPLDWKSLALDLIESARTRRILLCTGFPVGGHPETDGPPGTLMLASALHRLGAHVALVSIASVLDAVEGLPQMEGVEKCEIPAGKASPRIDGVPVTIEICGRVKDCTYRNMRHVDISTTAPWIEGAIGEEALISVGDGGNEFGFGSAPEQWFLNFPVQQPVSRCRYLVPAEVSNWGALAIVAFLEKITRKRLMPKAESYAALLEELVHRGMVDGVSGEKKATEDGFATSMVAEVIGTLTAWARDVPPELSST